MKVGFVGLGQMGAPMAAHLVDWPDGLVVCDTRAEACDPLVALGAEAVSDPGAVVRAGARVVSVMVVDDAQVEAVVAALVAAEREGGGLLADSQLVVAIHSTIGPHLAPRLAEAAAVHGIAVLDAPVSGGVQGARDARLAVMVGADAEVFARCRPVLERIGGLVVNTGPVGSATRAKLARNMLQYVGFVAAYEAQRLAEAAGVDLRQLAAVVRHSDGITGGASSIMVRSTAAPMAGDDPLVPIFEHVRDLADKDLALALGLAAELGVPLPVSRLAAGLFPAGVGLAPGP